MKTVLFHFGTSEKSLEIKKGRDGWRPWITKRAERDFGFSHPPCHIFDDNTASLIVIAVHGEPPLTGDRENLQRGPISLVGLSIMTIPARANPI